MFDVETIPDRLAIFPLTGALLLPKGALPLNIFEPRYLAMLDDTLKTDHRMIGMIQPRAENAAGLEDLHPVGCMGAARRQVKRAATCIYLPVSACSP